MISRKLTPKQKEVYTLLSKNPAGKLRQHVKKTGLVCWRLLDEKYNPLLNISENVVDGLVSKSIIEKNGHDYVLCATVEI